MATANSSLRVTELDFDTIVENLKTFYRNQRNVRISSFDFEGAGITQLLNILAYNTHYMGVYLNIGMNEMFPDTAQLRNSVLSHSKFWNYVPTSQLGSTALVDILVTPTVSEDQTKTTATLFKWTPFISDNDNGVAYNFVSMNTVTSTKSSNGTFLFANVFLKQGDFVQNQYLFDSDSNPKRKFNIPSANVDISTFSMLVQASTSNTVYEIYTRADDITELNGNSAVYFIEESPESNGVFSFQFGDNYIGKKPNEGAVILTSYLNSVGDAANKSKRFTLTGSISGFSGNVQISSANGSSGGAPKEDIETIKFRGPKWYTAQNRAVTDSDYEILLPKDYPNIDAISVWGGEDADPPVYGKVYISIKPRDGYYITTQEKQRISDGITANRSIVGGSQPVIVDPEYLFLILNLQVRYNPNLTTLTEDDLKALIRERIIDYRDTDLMKFNSIFRMSKFLNDIDNVDSAILSSSLDYYIQKRFEPELEVSRNYTINFNTRLKNGSTFDKMYSFPSFQVYDNTSQLKTVYIEEVVESLTSISNAKITNPGSDYSSTPTITILGDGTGANAKAVIVNGRVQSIKILKGGTGYTKASMTIDGGGGTGARAIPILRTNLATLQTFYYKNTGEKVIINPFAGSINYVTGQLKLTNFKPISLTENTNYLDTILTLNIKPSVDSVKSVRNMILTLDETDSSSIQITMIPETATA